MTRTERLFARRRSMLALVAVLLFLTAAVALGWLKIQTESHRADQLATEADLRGNAVSTLAGDVRALRQQVKAKGDTPVAPDPTKAVPSLSSRAEVPVPIPGPPGPPGPTGPSGKPAPTITPSPGASGAPGGAGVPGSAGSPGPAGAQGDPGPAGVDGKDGSDGSNGSPPAGWTYTDPSGVSYDCEPVDGFDPNSPRYTCSPTAPAPTDSPSPNKGLLGVAALSLTAAYRKLGAHRAV